MKSTALKAILIFSFPLLTLLSACTSNGNKPTKPTFKQIWGKSFTEVRRSFANGISFSDHGYQLEPEWRFTILSDTSVSIFSPKTKAFEIAPIQFDHDSIFSFAWAWVKIKTLTQDSIIFQVMKVDDQRRVLNERSVVFMKFYSDDYIKNTLRTDHKTLIRPSRLDSIYIKEKAAKANAGSGKPFAARQEASFKSRNNLLTIKRLNMEPDKESYLKPFDEYLSPEYDVTIKNAYKKFSYTFTVLVDAQGKLSFIKSGNFIMPEFEEQENRTMRAIVDGYLTAYLDVKPGTTLGIAHPSVNIFHVKGI